MMTNETEDMRRNAREVRNTELRLELFDVIGKLERAISLSRGPDEARAKHWNKIAETRRKRAKELLET